MSTARRLWLVRHGLPDYRCRQPGDELPGPPLSPTGWEQAAQAAAALADSTAGAVYTSPLARTRQTAECVGRMLHVPVRLAGDLREWHRTERLYDVASRLTRWLVQWLRGTDTSAVVVSHASPLLAILRSALYLPHVGWHRSGQPDVLEVSSGDRFEVTMASVFELVFESRCVTARCRFHPEPRILHCLHGTLRRRLPRPVPGSGENRLVRRMNWLALLGVSSVELPDPADRDQR